MLVPGGLDVVRQHRIGDWPPTAGYLDRFAAVLSHPATQAAAAPRGPTRPRNSGAASPR